MTLEPAIPIKRKPRPPKKTPTREEIRDLYLAYSKEALEKIVEIMRDAETPRRESLKAAVHIATEAKASSASTEGQANDNLFARLTSQATGHVS